jgi:hypothetical protein
MDIITIRATEIRCGDSLWVEIDQGWVGPKVNSVDRNRNRVVVSTWNGGRKVYNTNDVVRVVR